MQLDDATKNKQITTYAQKYKLLKPNKAEKVYDDLRKSRYYEKIKKKIDGVENSKDFKEAKRKLPPLSKTEDDSYIKFTVKELDLKIKRTKNKNEKIRLCRFRAHKEFCNKFGLDFYSWKNFDGEFKVRLNRDIFIGLIDNKFPYLQICSKDVTDRDILDFVPLLFRHKEFYLGKAKTFQGRKNKADVYRAIREEYKRRIKAGEKKKDILPDMAKKYNYRVTTLERVALTK